MYLSLPAVVKFLIKMINNYNIVEVLNAARKMEACFTYLEHFSSGISLFLNLCVCATGRTFFGNEMNEYTVILRDPEQKIP